MLLIQYQEHSEAAAKWRSVRRSRSPPVWVARGRSRCRRSRCCARGSPAAPSPSWAPPCPTQAPRGRWASCSPGPGLAELTQRGRTRAGNQPRQPPLGHCWDTRLASLCWAGNILALLYLGDERHSGLDSLAQCRPPSLQSLSCTWSLDWGSCKSQNVANLHTEWTPRLLKKSWECLCRVLYSIVWQVWHVCHESCHSEWYRSYKILSVSFAEPEHKQF